MNNLEITSRILNALKSLTKDGRVSRRYVLKVAQEKARFLISQKLGENSLYREANLYKSLDCFSMEKIDTFKCPIIEFRSSHSVMRSKSKLPELIYSKYGASVKEATSIDGSFLMKPTTPYQYRLNRSRKTDSKERYFYVQDGYLYLPDSEVAMIQVSLITLDLYEMEKCSDCSSGECKSAWDYEFICSDKLLEAVIQETLKEVATTKQVQSDQNPNLNEGS
jgi:hypothetical protein